MLVTYVSFMYNFRNPTAIDVNWSNRRISSRRGSRTHWKFVWLGDALQLSGLQHVKILKIEYTYTHNYLTSTSEKQAPNSTPTHTT